MTHTEQQEKPLYIGQRLRCNNGVRGLKKHQYCEYIGGNDLVYQVFPLIGAAKTKATAHSINVPNYSVAPVESSDPRDSGPY